MKRTVALFGATLKQVAASVPRDASRDSAETSVMRSRALTIGLGLAAVVAATSASHANAQVLIQGAQENQQQTARDRAGTIGGVLGLAAGVAAAHRQNTVIKLVGAAAGYMGGQAIGEAIAGKAEERAPGHGSMGRPDRMRADPLGSLQQPQDARYATSMRGGRYGNEQVQISRAAYEQYIQQAASPVPVQGTNLRPLSTVVHQGLYRLMVDTVANRAVARAALDRVESMELESKVMQRGSPAALEYQRAQQDYATAMREYGNSFTSAWDVIRTAEKNGYEISAQRAAMSVVPGDMREPVVANLRWPGVEQKVAELTARASSSELDGANLSMLNARADSVMEETIRARAKMSRH